MGRSFENRAKQAPTYLVPKNTGAVLQSAWTDGYQHLGLLLGRYAPEQTIDSDFAWDRRTKWRDYWLKDRVMKRFDISNRQLGELQTAVHKRWEETIAGAETFQAKNRSRLIVGLGGKNVLEFGITLDHVSGLPIIPGSALKGLTRTYGLLVIAERLGILALNLKQLQKLKEGDILNTPLEIFDAALTEADDKKRREVLESLRPALACIGVDLDTQTVDQLAQALGQTKSAARYRAMFGSQEDSGDCIFYNAVVARLPGKALFELDVMTPHFKDYYDDVNSGSPQFNQYPHDGLNPVPIGFVTVPAGTTFAFAVGLRPGGDRKGAKQAVAWLKEALHELGVGAKTAAGYGVFEALEPD